MPVERVLSAERRGLCGSNVAREGHVLGATVTEVAGARSCGPGSCTEALGSTLSERESHQKVLGDMIFLESLKGVLMGTMWKIKCSLQMGINEKPPVWSTDCWTRVPETCLRVTDSVFWASLSLPVRRGRTS